MSFIKRIADAVSGGKKNITPDINIADKAEQSNDSVVRNEKDREADASVDTPNAHAASVKSKKIMVHPDVLKLLWIANGSQKNYSDIKQNKIPIAGEYAYIVCEENDFYQRDKTEPSLIYVDLPIVRSEDTVKFYNPTISYKDMPPEQRGAYWEFLEDPYGLGEKDHAPLNVFLCGLERHLFIGNHRQAIDTLVRLMSKYPEDIEVFRASSVILLSCICHNEKNLAASFLSSVTQWLPSWKTFPFSKDVFLLAKYELEIPVSAADIMHVAYAFNYKKRKYMKNDPERFEKLIEDRIEKRFGEKEFLLSEIIDSEDLDQCTSWKTYSLFKNYSFATHTVVPYLTHNEKLASYIQRIVEDVHAQFEAEESNTETTSIHESNEKTITGNNEITSADIGELSSRVPFSEMETALLLDVYLKGKQTYCPNAKMARIASVYLRRLASNQGMTFDESFRTEKGLAYQLRMMEAAFMNTSWHGRAVPAGFTEIVNKYNKDPEAFRQLVSEAYRIIGVSSEEIDSLSKYEATTIIDEDSEQKTTVNNRINHISFVDWDQKLMKEEESSVLQTEERNIIKTDETSAPSIDASSTTKTNGIESLQITPDSFAAKYMLIPEFFIDRELPTYIFSHNTRKFFREKEVSSYLELMTLSTKNISSSVRDDIQEHLENLSDESAEVSLGNQYRIPLHELHCYDEIILDEELSVRLRNILERENITILEQILQETPNSLKSIRGMGNTSYRELYQVVRELISNHNRPKDNENIISAEDGGIGAITDLIKIPSVLEESLPLFKQYGISRETLNELTTDLTHQNISVRLTNVLIRSHLVELGQVLELSPEQIRNLRNLGSKSYQELIENVQRLVMKLAEESVPTDENLSHVFQLIPTERRNTKIAGYIKAYLRGDKDKQNKLLVDYGDISLEEYYGIVLRSDDSVKQSNAIELLKWCAFDVHNELEDLSKSFFKNEREKEVLYDRTDGRSLIEIGHELGVTRERVRQIEKKSRKRIHDSLEQNAILLKIYAERDQDEVLTPTELMEYFGEQTPVILYVLRSEEGSDYIYDDNLDVFVIDNDTLPDKVEAYTDTLPEIMTEEEYKTAIEKGIREHGINEELLGKAMAETYSISGSVYHRKKLSLRKMYELTVEKYYTAGIHIYDQEAMQGFRNHVYQDFGKVKLPEKDRAIAARIADCCILCGRGVYKPKSESYIGSELLSDIEAHIRNSQTDVIPIGSIYSVFQERLNHEGVDNRFYLQGILHELLGSKFSFRRDYVFKSNTDTSFYLEISEYIRENSTPVTKEQLRRRYPGVTDIVINFATADKEILNYYGSYYHAIHLKITEDERAFIQKAIDNSLSNAVRVNCRELFALASFEWEQWLNENYIFNQYSLFTVLEYLFDEDFNFNRPYIARKDAEVDEILLDDELVDVLEQKQYGEVLRYCMENGIDTVADLVLDRGLDVLKTGGIDNETVLGLQNLFSDVIDVPTRESVMSEVHPSAIGLDVSVLCEYGVPSSSIEILRTNSVTEIGKLSNISGQMLQGLIGSENAETIRNLQQVFRNDIFKILEQNLANKESLPAYTMIISGPKQYGDGSKLEIRTIAPSAMQLINDFLERLSPFMDVVVSQFMLDKNHITEQEIIDIYDNDDYDQVLMYWCNHSGHLQYLKKEECYILADDDANDSAIEYSTQLVDQRTQLAQSKDEILISKIREVLREHYAKGFRLNSPIALRKFRRFFTAIAEDTSEIDDEQLRQMILKSGICFEDMVYLPEGMADQKIKDVIMQHIRVSFASGIKGIYYDALYKELSEQLLDSCIYSPEMLREYLNYMNDGSYYVNKRFISSEPNYKFNTYEEVKRILCAESAPITIEEVHSKLAGIPLQKIRFTLASNNDFISDGSSRYFYVDQVALTEEDLEEIKRIIRHNIDERTFLSGTELLGTLRDTREEIFETNAEYSDLGIRNAIAYQLSKQFSFNGNIISDLGSSVTMADVFAEFCSSHDRFTLSELNLLKDEMGSTIYFDQVYANSLRISEENFVSKDQAEFDVEDTDKAIERFCKGNYIPLAAVTQFGSFPKAGFEWNSFLLEHYVADYSQEFFLLHGSYNASKCVGAIVKRGSGITSFENILSRALADSNTELKKDAALQFFCDNGYIARRKLSGIEQVIIEAQEFRNRKGLN